ncbi:hypothetical protein C2I36_06640 [Rhodobacteraceae bacterium WD3A24]|nr:hypothetical protein C2I36_06640 [Rhodobacteraceae bacterium WD3A24]
MRHGIIAAALAVIFAPMGGGAAAGPIESACLRSERGADRALCGCIQSVADRTLARSEQRQAARFFRDPQRAQDVRMSDRDFWARYTAFGSAAERSCAS